MEKNDPEDAVAQIQYTYNDRTIGSTYLTIKGIKARQNYDVLDTMSSVDSKHVPVETIPPKEEKISDPSSSSKQVKSETSSEKSSFFENFRLPKIPAAVWIALACILCIGGIVVSVIAVRHHMQEKEARNRRLRRERRAQRLKDIGCSESEFDIIMEERKRSAYTVKHRPHRSHRPHRKRHFR